MGSALWFVDLHKYKKGFLSAEDASLIHDNQP